MSILSRLIRLIHPPKEASMVESAKASHHFICDADIDLDNFPSCPRCGAQDVAMIIYGSPMMTTKIHAAFESGRLLSGGCMVRKSAPAWHCHQCGVDYGRLGPR